MLILAKPFLLQLIIHLQSGLFALFIFVVEINAKIEPCVATSALLGGSILLLLVVGISPQHLLKFLELLLDDFISLLLSLLEGILVLHVAQGDGFGQFLVLVLLPFETTVSIGLLYVISVVLSHLASIEVANIVDSQTRERIRILLPLCCSCCHISDIGSAALFHRIERLRGHPRQDLFKFLIILMNVLIIYEFHSIRTEFHFDLLDQR